MGLSNIVSELIIRFAHIISQPGIFLIIGLCSLPGRYIHNEIEDPDIVIDAWECQKKCQLNINCHYWSFNAVGICRLHNKYAPYNWEYCAFDSICLRGPRVCQQGI